MARQAPNPKSEPAVEPILATVDDIRAAISHLNPLDIDRLLAHLAPDPRRRQRLAKRDALIRSSAEGHFAGSARALATALARFYDSGYRRSADGEGIVQACLRGILDANQKRLIRERQLQNIITGERTPIRNS